eukprot:scaffold114203_cov19-Tisochrysis_lutea.AAC.1
MHPEPPGPHEELPPWRTRNPSPPPYGTWDTAAAPWLLQQHHQICCTTPEVHSCCTLSGSLTARGWTLLQQALFWRLVVMWDGQSRVEEELGSSGVYSTPLTEQITPTTSCMHTSSTCSQRFWNLHGSYMLFALKL